MRFFNKSFLKFTLGFLVIILVSMLFIAAVNANASSVEKLIFITEEQTIKPSQLSEGLTIQTQDSSGTPIQTPETIDLEFLSTSQTGEFLNSSGSSVSKTMNRNTSNRTFYYKDSTQGDFILTIKATGRETGKTWQATQKIKISDSANNIIQGEVLSGNTESKSLSATSGVSLPTYSTQTLSLEVSAGADRLTSPGSPISFQAQIKKNSSANSSVVFSWSFGDGNVGDGALVNHTYKYPGEYALVLNARSGNVFATARAKVVVVENNISVSDNFGIIELKNNSKYEINLFNWKIVKEDKGFIFQPDTIILPGKSILIDESMLKMKTNYFNGVILKNSLDGLVATSSLKLKDDEMLKIKKEVDSIKSEASKIIDSAISNKIINEHEPIVIKSFQDDKEKTSQDIEENDVELKIDNNLELEKQEVLFESPKKEGMIGKLTNLVKRLLSK